MDLHELPRLRSFKMKSILVGARKDLKNNILRFVFLPTPKGPTRLETIQLSLVIPTSTQVFEELVKEPFAWPRLEPFRITGDCTIKRGGDVIFRLDKVELE